MKLVIFSFTGNGSALNRKLVAAFQENGDCCEGYTTERFAERFLLKKTEENMQQQIGALWGEAALIFIGAAGIAVRMIAPWVKDKYTDSAVIVLDEKGKFIVPLLSGHVGGAIEIAGKVAEYTGGTLVLTTATDVQKKFAVDVFAKKNGLIITDRVLAKEISAAVLEGKRIGIYSDLPVEGEMPDELEMCESEENLQQYEYGILIADWKEMMAHQYDRETENGKNGSGKVLALCPQNIIVGIGCRKGKEKEKIQKGLEQVLGKLGLDKKQIKAFASIDLKKEETGIVEIAGECGVPFYTFSAEELRKVTQVSSHSAFVAQVTGVDNVCERAVKCLCPDGEMLLTKTCIDGMTFAVGKTKRILSFETRHSYSGIAAD